MWYMGTEVVLFIDATISIFPSMYTLAITSTFKYARGIPGIGVLIVHIFIVASVSLVGFVITEVIVDKIELLSSLLKSKV